MRRFGYFALPMLLFVPLAALALMLLWNWLVPALFAIGTITFWQALGLLILLRILIGPRFGFPFYRGWYGHRWYGHRRHRHFWKQRMYEKWASMSEEDREKFRNAFQYRHCYPFGYAGDSSTKEEEKTN